MKTDDEFLNLEEETANGCALLILGLTVFGVFVVLAMACNWANSF